MKHVVCVVKGISPLLMHAFPMAPIEGIEKRTPKEQAEAHVYRRPDTRALYVPGINFQRGIVAAATYSKGKGRGSLAKIAAAAILVADQYLDISPQDWVVDSRPVVIAATRGRIIRHRARFDSWSIAASVEYDETLLTEGQLRRCIDDLGSRVGLLDFRPERRGPFGRFMITSWEANTAAAMAAE